MKESSKEGKWLGVEERQDRGHLPASVLSRAEMDSLRKSVLADCSHLSPCSSFPRLMQCLETCNSFTAQSGPLTLGLGNGRQRSQWP